MQTHFKYSLFLALLFFSNLALAQSEPKDTSFIVNGVCGMCQKTIESAVKKTGATEVHWNKETKILQFRIDQEKVSFQKVVDAVAKTGYDSEFITAKDEDYAKLHECCKYRDPEVVSDHKD